MTYCEIACRTKSSRALQERGIPMKEYLLRLLDYELWADQSIIVSLQSVDNPPARAVKIMGHILSAQLVWLRRIQGHPTTIDPWQYIPLVDMSERAENNHRLLKTHLTSSDDWQPTRIVAYQNSQGESFENSLQDILAQLSHHSAYHRGQVVQLITPQLAQVPTTDYIFWRRG